MVAQGHFDYVCLSPKGQLREVEFRNSGSYFKALLTEWILSLPLGWPVAASQRKCKDTDHQEM